eukprot:CAMPEP_0168536664 /NCGR_PEP_ID=MMETSP0405-20121227/19733_1 /TAXON_ID=498012 /ORGANISM="Trichosphaerium sp, Strain Am-I-7 wt" /LENGTH=189 /DNA_ID=CAMNT_0008564811 /DNA_START=69 /DNA_END=635 /DNA_ORIENTATION=-
MILTITALLAIVLAIHVFMCFVSDDGPYELGYGFIIGAIIVETVVILAASSFFDVFDATRAINSNTNITMDSDPYDKIFAFDDQPVVAISFYGEYKPNGNDAKYTCVAPIALNSSIFYNITLLDTVHYYAYCTSSHSCKTSDCMNTWTQDEYLGLRIRSVDVKSAEKAANNAANNYNLTNSENLTFVYW